MRNIIPQAWWWEQIKEIVPTLKGLTSNNYTGKNKPTLIPRHISEPLWTWFRWKFWASIILDEILGTLGGGWVYFILRVGGMWIVVASRWTTVDSLLRWTTITPSASCACCSHHVMESNPPPLECWLTSVTCLADRM